MNGLQHELSRKREEVFHAWKNVGHKGELYLACNWYDRRSPKLLPLEKMKDPAWGFKRWAGFEGTVEGHEIYLEVSEDGTFMATVDGAMLDPKDASKIWDKYWDSGCVTYPRENYEANKKSAQFGVSHESSEHQKKQKELEDKKPTSDLLKDLL